MKILIPCLIYLFIQSYAYSNDREHEKIQLQQLVQDRETRFGEYSRAAASRSGIFGNKTKKDLKGQVEILTEIIKTDNRIISLLNNFLDYRTFQRTEQTYDQAELDARNKRLSETTNVLSKKVQEITAENKSIKFSLKWARLWNFVLIGVVLVLSYFLWRRRAGAGM